MKQSRSVLIIQHEECEGPGAIAHALSGAGLDSEICAVYGGALVPSTLLNHAGLVVMGGPMGVYEQKAYPFLAGELRLIDSALAESKPILGVCLGSQLLASALGADVRRGLRREIGWHSVTLTDAAVDDLLWRGVSSPFTPLHWHGDVFDLPKGATWLASSELTPFQCFRHGETAYGFLFHLEMDLRTIETLAAASTRELAEANVDRDLLLGESPARIAAIESVSNTVLARWAKLVHDC